MLFGNYTNMTRPSSSRWNINQFTSGTRSRSNYAISKDLSENDAQELDKIIRGIDIKFDRFDKDLSKFSTELNLIKSNLKKRIERFSSGGEPTETEIMYRKAEADIVTSQLGIIKEKSKLFLEKTKTIREEKKQMYDRLKGSGGISNDVQSIGMPGGPVNTASMMQQMGGQPMGVSLNPAMMEAIKGMRPSVSPPPQETPSVGDSVTNTDTNDTTFQVESQTSVPIQQPKAVVETPVQTSTQPNSDVLLKNSINIDNIPNSKVVINGNGSIGQASDISVGEQYRNNRELYLKREREKETMFKNQKGVLNAKMSSALNSLNNNMMDIKEVMHIDMNSGRYWVEGYVDNNGTRELVKDYRPKSLKHLGHPRFDIKNQVAKSPHYDESMSYVMSDDSNMSSYYKEQWERVGSEKYVLGPDILERML